MSQNVSVTKGRLGAKVNYTGLAPGENRVLLIKIKSPQTKEYKIGLDVVSSSQRKNL